MIRNRGVGLDPPVSGKLREGVNESERKSRHEKMDLPDAIAHFLSKLGAGETTPFGPEVLVYKVSGKMFAVTEPDEFPARINLKCDPERALALRYEYDAIIPGYHMNKRHWNTLVLDGSLPAKLVRELIDHSYDLVVASLPKSRRNKAR